MGIILLVLLLAQDQGEQENKQDDTHELFPFLLCDRHQAGIRLPGNHRSTPVHGFRLLPTSLTFSPACLTLPAAWSALPSASSRSLPTVLPAASLALPLSSWALFLVLSVSLITVPSPRGLAY